MNSQFLAAALLALLCVQVAWAQVTPAKGNSVAFIASIKNGTQTYLCKNDGNWELASASATLVNVSDPPLVLGDYLQVVDDASVIQWSVRNSWADQSESGENYTFVSGKQLVSNETDDLYEIVSRNQPIVARYSFIQSHSDDSGPPHLGGDCNNDTTSAFHGTFTFYTQDTAPPATAAVGVSVPTTQRPLQSLFCSGSTLWTQTSSSGKLEWVFQSAGAALSELPGGPQVGSLAILPGYSATWSIADPSGWNVTATSAHSTSLAAEDWPWQLFSVTSETGQLANRTFVQLLSTKGGIPPSDEVIGAGETLSVEFSGVSWFYTPIIHKGASARKELSR